MSECHKVTVCSRNRHGLDGSEQPHHDQAPHAYFQAIAHTLYGPTKAPGHPLSATIRQSKIIKPRIASISVNLLDFDLLRLTIATMEDTSTKLSCSMEPLSNNDFVHVFFPTLGLIALTVVLELLSHETLACSTIGDDDDVNNTRTGTNRHGAVLPVIVEEQPRPQPPPEAQASTSASEQSPASTQKKTPASKSSSCLPNVSPNIRANRLITAIFLYTGIITLFIIRMRDITVPHLRPECADYISLFRASDKMPAPMWWVFVPLNILPFVCASCCLLRTIVDCVLVRWGLGLGYSDKKAGNTLVWPVCMPLKALWFLPYMTIKVLMVFPIAFMMGRPLRSAWSNAISKTQTTRKDDIEMQSEEARRLVDDMDGDEEAEGHIDGPPAYDEAVHEREPEIKET